MATAGDLILSIRSQIPDPAPSNDPNLDGRIFAAETLLRWINDAAKILCAAAPIIQDWTGIASIAGQDVYILPSEVLSVDQVWYDAIPLERSRELDHLYVSRPTGRAYWFGPHAVHSIPRLHVYPVPSRNAGQATLASALSEASTSLTLTTPSPPFNTTFGYIRISDGTNEEILRFSGTQAGAGTVTLQNLLRGQWLTDARAWPAGTAVTELNLMYKCARLPRPLTSADTPMEVPLILWPALELYVMANVREAEQDHATALQLRQAFLGVSNDLAQRHAVRGLRHGIQVRPSRTIDLLRGRTIVP